MLKINSKKNIQVVIVNKNIVLKQEKLRVPIKVENKTINKKNAGINNGQDIRSLIELKFIIESKRIVTNKSAKTK